MKCTVPDCRRDRTSQNAAFCALHSASAEEIAAMKERVVHLQVDNLRLRNVCETLCTTIEHLIDGTVGADDLKALQHVNEWRNH